VELACHVTLTVTNPDTPGPKIIAALNKLQATNELLEQQNKLLRERVELLLRQLYGSKSERLDPGQLELLLEGAEVKKPDAADTAAPADESAADPKAPRKKRNNPLRKSMENLPVVEDRIVPLEVQADREAFRKIGEEVSDRLEVIPAEYFIRRTIREIYQRKDRPEQPPITPPLPTPLLEGSVLSASLLADILDKKYCQHLPFYRQEWIMRNAHGLQISRNLLCHWHDVGAQLLEPLYKLQLERLRACSYLQADETPVNYLEPGHGRAKKGYFWVLRNPTQGVVYRWQPGRAREHLESLLFDDKNNQRFEGQLQCDAYAVYQSLAAVQPDSITLGGCMAHIRRKFHEALDDQPRYAAWVLKQIARLYRIERTLRNLGADFGDRRAMRQRRAKPIHRWLGRALVGLRAHPSVLPSSPFGKALDYALHQWHLHASYLENGEMEIDNNLVENDIRPLKLGAKNWLFIGRESTGWRTAVVLTMVENIRRHGYSPRAYLQWVFERLPGMTNQDDLSQLLPDAWIAMQEPRIEKCNAA
jgi:transposase